MHITYQVPEVTMAIKAGFNSLRVLARAELAKRWKGLSTADKYAAGRSLVYMGDVAKDYEKYFSRANTEVAWRERAAVYAQQHKLENMAAAYYIIPDPTGIVIDNSYAALYGRMWSDFYKFASCVQCWEYARSLCEPYDIILMDQYGEKIKNMTARYRARAEVQQSNPLVRPLKRLMNGKQIQR